jgi:hypothetical protein
MAERKKKSGLVIVIYVMAAAALLVILVGGIVLVITGVKAALFFGGEDGKKMIEGVKETYEIAMEAQKAPGTEELRAAGCDTASVMNLADMMDAVSNFVGEEDQKELEAVAESQTTMVICQVSFGDDPPLECDEIARVYGAAVPEAPEELMIQSQKAGRIKDHCVGIYAPDGTFLRAIDAQTFEPAPAEPAPAEPVEVPIATE